MFMTNAKDAAKAEDGIRHFAACLLDHEPFDRAHFFPVGTVDIRTLHFIAADHVGRFLHFPSHGVTLSFIAQLN
jgi:hypothetical protein